jgi:hypothetical protein
MSTAYRRSKVRLPGDVRLSLEDAIEENGRSIGRVQSTGKRTQLEVALSARLHRLVKSAIPRFSLDRGFEFSNTVAFGERQCFLQSVIIAGFLQKAGVHAGVVMVYRNIRGEESNNGHAVTLVKLSNGHDLIVDASDPVPFVEQQGLFIRDRGYIYVKPVYEKRGHTILYYIAAANGRKIASSRADTLDYDFIRSQFYYYRGERAPGGVFAQKKTKAGLLASARALQRSVRLSPGNPLAVYMLGRAMNSLGDAGRADMLFVKAYRLYSGYGWVPAGAKETYALARSRKPARAGSL